VARPLIVKSFIIADAVIQDRLTGKWSIIGVFDRVMAPSFPVVHPTVALYLRLSDAQGRYRLRVEFRDASDRRVGLFEGIEMEVKDPTQAIEVGLPTHMLPLEKPGKYQFQLFINDEYAASAELSVIQISVPPQTPPAAPPP
jgi:hypothetical protein